MIGQVIVGIAALIAAGLMIACACWAGSRKGRQQ